MKIKLLLLILLCQVVWSQKRLDKYLKNGPKQQLTEKLIKGGKAPADYLLPEDILPTSYDLSIIAHLEDAPLSKQFTFDGTMKMELSVAVTTNKIVMHAWDLNVGFLELRKASDNSLVAISSWNILTDDRQFFTINVESPLVAGALYNLQINYTGTINDELYGFYRYSYVSEGSTIWMAVTDFEPTGARRLAPMFDQPDIKARITLHVGRTASRQVTSNMPISSQGDPILEFAGYEWVHFNETPPISSYIFCFSVHMYANITDITDPRFNLYGRSEMVNEGQYALDLTKPVVEYYESIFNIPYTLPKLDSVLLISFAWGGMENWGHINYLERITVFNTSEHTTWDKRKTATLVAHEIAHQWFGNLVSPDWWKNTWLNEGFATYYEDHWNGWQGSPNDDWQLDETFIWEYLHDALRADASTNTHALYADFVDSPNSAANIFDTISYSKGGCIVRFMSNFLGETNFRLGIHDYITAMQEKAADQSDLFRHLSPYAPPMPNGVTFSILMDSWTKQAGFPLLTITRDYNQNTAIIQQERFGSLGTEHWIIPITLTNAAGPNFDNQSPQAWFEPGQTQINISSPIVPSNLQWLIINVKATGYYRVNYDSNNWALISSFMSSSEQNTNSIAPENRAQLMDDALELAKIGRLDYTTALQTTAYLNYETRLAPWLCATDNLAFIRDRVYQTTEGVNNFQLYMRLKLQRAYSSVTGFQSNILDSTATNLLRMEVTEWACNMVDPTCNAEANVLYQQWKQTPNPDVNNPIPTDAKGTVYCAGLRQGFSTDYTFLLTRYMNSQSAIERERLLNGMGCSTDPAVLNNYLVDSLNPNIFLSGDAIDVLQAVSYNPIGVDMALDFVIANWLQLDSLYGGIGNGFYQLRNKLNTQQQRDKIQQFRDTNLSLLSLESLNLITSTLATLDENIEWNFAYLNTVLQYFNNAY